MKPDTQECTLYEYLNYMNIYIKVKNRLIYHVRSQDSGFLGGGK